MEETRTPETEQDQVTNPAQEPAQEPEQQNAAGENAAATTPQGNADAAPHGEPLATEVATDNAAAPQSTAETTENVSPPSVEVEDSAAQAAQNAAEAKVDSSPAPTAEPATADVQGKDAEAVQGETPGRIEGNKQMKDAQLLAWWDSLSFTGKEHYGLSDKGALTVTQNANERTIANLTAGNYEATYKQLTDKFTELQGKVNEVAAEWEKNEDKAKLAGRVERLRENIQHANAIGDLNGLAVAVGVWDKQLQEVSQANYELKSQLVSKAEQLADADNFKEGTVAFRELTEEWKKIGYTDKQRSDELWGKIEEAKNKFHERKRQYHGEQEKDMLRNLDLKMELVDKAEKLAASEEWRKTAEAYKQLMEEWKATGPTMHDKNEELWAKFNAAKTNFFDRKRAHGKRIGEEQEENYAKKLVLVEQAEAMKDSTEWNKTVQAYSELMEEWKKIGRVPGKKSDEIWNRLKAAKDHFFNAKREYFDTRDVEFENNLIQKKALVQRANALKNSTNWRDTADEMMELMEEWKKIGQVPHKVKDEIWDEFNGARKHFFARKDENREKHKQYAEKKQGQRLIDNHNFLNQLEEELKDDEARLIEFREDVKNVTPGPKEKQLREHLTNLIAEIESGLETKRAKIEKVRKELEEMNK